MKPHFLYISIETAIKLKPHCSTDANDAFAAIPCRHVSAAGADHCAARVALHEIGFGVGCSAALAAVTLAVPHITVQRRVAGRTMRCT
jgi:hypothetical protein